MGSVDQWREMARFACGKASGERLEWARFPPVSVRDSWPRRVPGMLNLVADGVGVMARKSERRGRSEQHPTSSWGEGRGVGPVLRPTLRVGYGRIRAILGVEEHIGLEHLKESYNPPLSGVTIRPCRRTWPAVASLSQRLGRPVQAALESPRPACTWQIPRARSTCLNDTLHDHRVAERGEDDPLDYLIGASGDDSFIPGGGSVSHLACPRTD